MTYCKDFAFLVNLEGSHLHVMQQTIQSNCLDLIITCCTNSVRILVSVNGLDVVEDEGWCLLNNEPGVSNYVVLQ